MKKATSILSGLALTSLLALSVLGQTPEMKPTTNDNAQSNSTSAQSPKHAKKKRAKKSQTTTSNSTDATKQSAKHKY